MTNVLVIDDDPKICLFFSKLLKQMGHEFETAHSLKQGEALFRAHAFDLVLLDLELPDGNGLELMPELVEAAHRPEVIIVTGTGNVRGAELAFKYGAWDYVQKPFLLEEVSLPITRALQYREEKQTKEKPVPLVRDRIIGDSEPIQKSLEEVAKAAATDVSVLITGETGTGKELFARAIHQNSRRSQNAFVAVDCGALPETLVESTLFGHEKGAFTGAAIKQEGLITQAHGGTLMLDEVGDLPLSAQKSLLRTLQERVVRPIGSKRGIPVDIRLVAATNLDLDQMVTENRFRNDLLYRIRAMEIKLPALRDRDGDIELIALNKLHELSGRYNMTNKAVSPEFFKSLSKFEWPGNVRELINVLEYALASAGMDPTLFPKHLPPEYRIKKLDFEPAAGPGNGKFNPEVFSGETLPKLHDYKNQLEKNYLKELIRQVEGDRKEACRISGISQSRLYTLLNKHNLPGFSTV